MYLISKPASIGRDYWFDICAAYMAQQCSRCAQYYLAFKCIASRFKMSSEQYSCFDAKIRFFKSRSVPLLQRGKICSRLYIASSFVYSMWLNCVVNLKGDFRLEQTSPIVKRQFMRILAAYISSPRLCFHEHASPC